MAVVGVVGLYLCVTGVVCCGSGWCCWTVCVCDRSRLLLRWLVLLDCVFDINMLLLQWLVLLD